ncbi:molybdopterin molybdotransferase MoeA [Marivibrio halodurans]|uniref:Molybdopterin molybdenumtransferase n=1 Tax=Marivibrio halodurans TaxID=2039722 RepID=A0A8J7V1T1_9PROT|nr:gephyrin-like molybdotransferase Glp [Marivibrio halodurans]MBP5856665.1 molybdopterin molybdotransferase MoeA [Marivibrio halodurans]
MARLTDDCFAFDGPPVTVEEARARLLARIGPVAGEETVPLDRAAGRVLAADVTARVDVPPYDNAAVDGFALHADDLPVGGEVALPVTGRVAAGHPLGRPQRRGEAVRIFTGAPIPHGEDESAAVPDTVMMVEDARVETGIDGVERVTLPAGLARGANLRRAGEDVAAGSIALREGVRLSPPEVGLLAALGLDRVPVRRPLRVALFSTGDEVAVPGGPLAPGKLYDSNRYMIGSALRGLGFDVRDLGILPDRRAAIEGTMTAAAREADAILSTGGMSMGEEDHVRAAIEALGRLSFWRIAIKPGRPVGMGMLPDGSGGHTPFVGLPGNPVAALTTFVLLARPMLRALQGERVTEPRCFPVTLGFAYKKKAGRREYLRVALETPSTAGSLEGAPTASAMALPVARRHGKGGSAMLSSLVGADGFVDVAEDRTHLEEGETVAFLPFSEVLR